MRIFQLITILITTLILISCKKITFEDIDGNSYNAKKIGKLIWATKNLEVKKYRNGDIIPQVQDPNEWALLTSGAWCYYENDSSKGVLYNWYAVNDIRGLAPLGWHIPCNDEWANLINHLGGEDVAVEKLKSTSGWSDNGTNSSGFSAYPGGSRGFNGTFYGFGISGYWWSSSEFNSDRSWYQGLDNYYFNNYTIKGDALSIRCVKD